MQVSYNEVTSSNVTRAFRTGRIRKTFHKASTYTLLDAAALATTAPLDLSDPATAPDFTAVSFYKIFGFPNIGALIVRKASGHVLQNRRYFGGGTVDMIISINDTWHAKKDATIHDRLEDGTLPFHSIFALDHAISVHERLYGPNPMKFISMHTAQLGRKLYEGLSKMTHSNGTPVARIYKDENAIYGDPTVQGATIAFNVQRPDGTLIGFEEVEEAADERQIYVRSGSLCNPGGVATYLEWSPAEMRAAYAAGHRCANPRQIVFGKATGVVRVSLGAMSVAADVTTFLDFMEEVYVDQYPAEPELDAKEFLMSLDQAKEYDPLYPHSLSVRSASRASAGRASQISIPHSIPHALHIPPSEYNPTSAPPTPSSKSINGSKGGEKWTDSTTMASSASAHELDTDRPRSNPKPPPFIASDYTSNRRPWEQEMRKHTTTAEAEAKFREMEETIAAANRTGQSHSNTVKARRFGRSVVNLLRQKSNHALGDNGNRYEPPDK
jgi:molybdenum cofactor sulfurtransferase